MKQLEEKPLKTCIHACRVFIPKKIRKEFFFLYDDINFIAGNYFVKVCKKNMRKFSKGNPKTPPMIKLPLN